MAALPLFSSSFMPQGSLAFAPTRPTRVGPPPRPVSPPLAAGPIRDLFSPPPVDPASRPPSIVEPASHPPSIVEPASPPPSTVERTEAALRDAGLAGRFWRGDALSSSPLPSTPSGFRLLDEQLPGGGWPSRCLTELLIAHTGVGEIRFLASTLAMLTRTDREIVLLAPPHIPDPTGWGQLGIDMRRVLVVRTERPADRLWAIEQSLKSSAFGALLAWLPEEKTLARHDVLRRLQSVASSANGLSFLIRPSAAQYHASPASLRLTLATGEPDGHRRTLSVRLLKRRGPVLARPLTLMLPVHRGMTFTRGLPTHAPMHSPTHAPIHASRSSSDASLTTAVMSSAAAPSPQPGIASGPVVLSSTSHPSIPSIMTT